MLGDVHVRLIRHEKWNAHGREHDAQSEKGNTARQQNTWRVVHNSRLTQRFPRQQLGASCAAEYRPESRERQANNSPIIDNASHHRTSQPFPPYDIPSLPAALTAQGLSWRNYADSKSS
jgi:hypothetical protein